MKKYTHLAKIISLVTGCAFLMSGCATVFEGMNQKVNITTSYNGTDFPNVQCTIDNKGEKINIITPETVKLPRKSKDLHIICQKDGYKMLHAAILERQSHFVASAGGGALTGAGAGAFAAAPFMMIPVIGIPFLIISVSAGSLIGGATSAAADGAIGGAYSLPDHIDVPMIRSNQDINQLNLNIDTPDTTSYPDLSTNP